MGVQDDGQDKYPSGLFHLGLLEGFPEIGKSLQRCPQPAIDAYREGQLLAWLCQYGIGNSFLKKSVETSTYPFFKLVDPSEDCAGETTGLVLDFRELEGYDYKEDYEPYGGVAFLTINSAAKKLELSWVVTPRTEVKILLKEKNQAFRRAESMLLSSLYFSVIAGKHLAEIHMTYNLLEVAAHNSFDVALNKYGPSGSESFNAHPLRLYLYIHLFSHGLAEEETTEHLVQRDAVFSQIFALKYDSLADYLSKKYNDFVYASDEDFEYRRAIMEPLRRSSEEKDEYDVPPFSSGLEWELEYFSIFERYAQGMAESIYGTDDANVQNDTALQGFYKTLECVFNKMPERYDQFQTVRGVTRFMADSTHHLVVRHQFYGTTAVAAAMDPRIGSTQTPKDGGPPAVDEWRSLAFIALATAYANFVHIIEDPDENPDSLEQRPLQDIFKDATPVENSTVKKSNLVHGMRTAWNHMQHDLIALNDKWVETDVHHHYGTENRVSPTNWKTDVNYMYCRPLPQDLHTGPGY